MSTEDITNPTAITGVIEGVNEIASVAAQLADRTAAALQPRAVYREGDEESYFVAVPPGYSMKNITDELEKTQPAPWRARSTVTLRSLDSLIAYCKRMESSDAATIYANADTGQITAVFNDHADRFSPGWRDLRASFKAEHTPEFLLWKNRDKQLMDQLAFAEFIEARMADIADPAVADALLRVATTIQAKTGINFSSARRLDNGAAQITYNEVIDARAGEAGNLTIPTQFYLGLRVYKGDATGVRFLARLKYRLSSGAVKFFYEIDRPERVVETAFATYLERLSAESGALVLQGDA